MKKNESSYGGIGAGLGGSLHGGGRGEGEAKAGFSGSQDQGETRQAAEIQDPQRQASRLGQTSPKVNIRPAAAAEVPVIVALIRDLAEYEKAAPGALTLTEDRLREALFGPNPAIEARVAVLGDEVAGYALFFHNFSSWRGTRGLFLEDLFVRPERRGQGIGKALFAEVTRIARERGCPRLEWLVLDWNQTAIDFYKSQGAEPLDGWTTFRLKLQ